MSYFVERFRFLLSEKNMSTVDFKEKVGISTTQSGKYLAGYYEPSLKNIIKICEYFKCSIDYIMGLDDIPNRFGNFNVPSVSKFLDRYNDLLIKNKTNHNRATKELKFNRNNLIYWKQNKTFPTLTILYNLANYLSTSIEYLIGRTDIRS
ncbi:MAG: helix-turn-helix domain-containing protein [Clostridia bacterium]|nr:helix-turn-helix domain-containing protein [Clostridia bacterium]